MTDRYQQFTRSGLGKLVVSRLGLPNPAPLRRYEPGQPLLTGPALLGAADGGRLTDAVSGVLKAAGAQVLSTPTQDETRYGALVFDATGIATAEQLTALHEFFHPVIRAIAPNGRVIVLGTPPEDAADVPARVAQRALEGFTRSVGKELKRGATAQLVHVAPGAEHAAESTLRFLLSAKSAYVDAQVIRIGAAEVEEPADWDHQLAGKVALVTGASRGIGAAIAEVLARDGAHVVCLDVPAQGGDLSTVANRVGGSALQLDITSAEAPAKLVAHFTERHDGVDIVVHNAGITRDRTLGKMDTARWESVISVNLASQLRVNEALLAEKVLRPNGRIIGVSSIAGIAGNLGQTNYASSKAGVIGMVDALAPVLAKGGSTINAVAPGFIETQMTAAVPVVTREFGRRLSSLAQGGLPVDVAETIAWYASPASAGVNGNVVRVCGQSLLGGVMGTHELTSTPNLLPLFGKAVLTGFTRRGGELPDTAYAQSGVRVDPEHLADYDRVCGFRLGDALPVTYPHVLAFPLQVKLMTDGDFPFPMVGSVHVANRITQTRPLDAGESLVIRVHAENLREHPRGRQFDIVSEVRADGEPVWTDVSTYLRRGGGSGASSSPEPAEPPSPQATWRVPDDIGRRYAEVSGDRNPIHLHPLTAKLFGFPRAIAHGMWTKARCLAAFEGRLPDAYTVDVRFKLPVLLPATLAFSASDGTFALHAARTGKPHLTGTVAPVH